MTDEAKKVVDALTCTSKKGFPCGSCKYFIRGASVDRCDGKQRGKDAADLIEKQSAEIVELREKLDEAKLGLIWYSMLDNSLADLIDENEQLRNQVYNLTLYLHDIIGSEMDYISERHPGLPGYNPAILAVRNEESL